MDNTIISVRINKELKEKMNLYEDVNWSAVLRKAIIENLDSKQRIDIEKRKKAFALMDKLRKKRVFDGGKNSTEIIRKWRDKRH